MILLTIFFFFLNGSSATVVYVIQVMIGFGLGYWALFVTIAAEQFGTNLRATVATTIPNFARGSLVPLTFIFTELSPRYLSVITTGVLMAIFCIGIAILSLWHMQETYGKDLDYLEMQMLNSPSKRSELVGA